MAIGSDPEIGIEFKRWGDMADGSREAWFQYIKEVWGNDLLGGYATLVYPNEELRRTYGAV